MAIRPSYGYNAQKNRLLSAGPLSYAYDNEGQLANAGGTGLTFDYNHRLVGDRDATRSFPMTGEATG